MIAAEASFPDQSAPAPRMATMFQPEIETMSRDVAVRVGVCGAGRYSSSFAAKSGARGGLEESRKSSIPVAVGLELDFRQGNYWSRVRSLYGFVSSDRCLFSYSLGDLDCGF